MYTERELARVSACLRRRAWLVCLPCALALAAGVAVFAHGQLTRNDSLWLVTVALTIVSGGALLFLGGVYLRPLRQYRQHVDLMLHGVRRETTGVFKSFSDTVCERDGVSCYPIIVNVGDKGEEQDDRLFYYDASKKRPDCALGARVTVFSNDRMVADFKAL